MNMQAVPEPPVEVEEGRRVPAAVLEISCLMACSRGLSYFI